MSIRNGGWRTGAAILAGLLFAGTVAAAEPATTDLERQMAEARRRLDEAARQMADLASQLAGAEIQRITIGHAPHAVLGVMLGEATRGGVKVATVAPDGPAAEAGLRSGDIIASINGHETKTPAELTADLNALPAEGTVEVGYLRDGELKHASVHTHSTFDVWPKVLPELPSLEGLAALTGPLFQHSSSWNDLEVATLSPRLGRYFGTDHGVLVVQAPHDPSLKLEDGDVILAIDDRVPKDGPHALRILGSYRSGESLKLKLMRDHKTVAVDALVPAGSDREFRHSAEQFLPTVPAPPVAPAAPSPGSPTA